jgi:hypothetical protein
MTNDVLIIQYYKTAVLFANYSILPSTCCLCTVVYYVTILIGSCPVFIDNMLYLWTLFCHTKCTITLIKLCGKGTRLKGWENFVYKFVDKKDCWLKNKTSPTSTTLEHNADRATTDTDKQPDRYAQQHTEQRTVSWCTSNSETRRLYTNNNWKADYCN